MAPTDLDPRPPGIRGGNAANQTHVLSMTRGEWRPARTQVSSNKLGHHQPNDLAPGSLSFRQVVVSQPAVVVGPGLSVP